MALGDVTPEKKPGWATAYESGYALGYRHGMADAKLREARSAQPTRRNGSPPRDVSGDRGELASAGQSEVPD